ncbi:MAG: PKD domain-containing protein, partial [Candidatus Natronoplasma sp.]
SSPAIGSDGTIYIGSWDNNLYAVNPEDGTEKWNLSTGFCVESSPAIGSDGTIYIGSYDNNLYAIGNDTTPPMADAGDDKTVEVGEEFTLDASGSSDNVGIASYEWDLDNGDAETGEQITYTYDEAGTYTVELTVTDEAGNSDTDTVETTVKESDGGDEDEGTPGFTSLLLLTATIIAVAIYLKKSKKR